MLRERMTFSPRKSDRQPLGHALKPGLVVFCLLAVTLVSAQNETTGSVFQGLITDSTGAVIIGPAVTGLSPRKVIQHAGEIYALPA